MTPDPPPPDLAQRTLELVDIASPSRAEADVYRYLRDQIPLELRHDDGESLLYATRTGRPLVLLAGHTDTVPPQGSLPGRDRRRGRPRARRQRHEEVVLAVMVELGHLAASTELAYDLGLLFFPREEVGPDENPLPGLFEAAPLLDEAALVVCLEPTDNTLQLGCLGNIDSRLVFEGRAAHSARPWLGVNAIALAVEGLRPLVGLEAHDVAVDGLVFPRVRDRDPDLTTAATPTTSVPPGSSAP